MNLDEVTAHIKYLKEKTDKIKGVKINYHEKFVSQMEAVLTRGDDKLCNYIEALYKKGCYLDAWGEYFNKHIWQDTAVECGLNLAELAEKEFSLTESLPWDFIDTGIDKTWLINEYKQAFDNAAESYMALQNLGVKNEDARAVLPNACPTKIIFTMNLRSLGHFMNERLCSRAQQEIRKMALLMVEELKNSQSSMGLNDEEMDIILSLCVPKCESGKIKFCPEHKSCGRQKTAKEINEIISKSKEDM